MKRRHRQSYGPTGRPALPGGGASEGGIGFSPKNAAPRPTTRRGTFGRIYDQLQHAPPTLYGGHHVCAAMQCNAISSRPSTGHVVALCDPPQPVAPTPHEWTSRRAPEGRPRQVGLAGQEQRDGRSQRPQRERGAKAPREDATSEAPGDGGGGWRSGGVWFRAGGGPGGPNRMYFSFVLFFFFCLGRRRSGSPGITLMSLGTGFGLCLKAEKWARCP